MSHDKHKQHRHDADKENAPTAGPSADDRGPLSTGERQAAELAAHGQLAHDRKARILGVSIDGDRTLITIGSGLQQGVTEDMQGYIPTAHGVLADFTVAHVGERISKAWVDATPDMIHEHPEVILNPSAKPAVEKHQDKVARIITVSIQDGHTVFGIGNGRLHGAFPSEKGVIVNAEGRRIDDFELERVESRVSYASTRLPIDHLQGATVILNPSDASVQRPAHTTAHNSAGPAPAADAPH